MVKNDVLNISNSEREIVRVLLVISNLEFGGAQRQVVELANAMDISRFEVHVCSLSDYVPLADQLRIGPDNFHILKKHYKFDLSVVTRLFRLIKRLKIDIVQGYLFDAIIGTRIAGRLANVPAIIGSERNTDYFLKKRQIFAYRVTRNMVDLVIANSVVGAEFNMKTLGHHRSQYRVVHNGVNTERFRPVDGNAVRRDLGIYDTESVIGMFASFKLQKNHRMFFSAARRVIERIPNVRFLVVGDILFGGMHGSQKYYNDIQKYVDELGIRERCVFLGNQADVAPLYAACAVTVLPSLFEGTPNVILESMACGIPVIATDVSDNSRIVPDGKVGYIVEKDDVTGMADRISTILTEPEKRKEMGHAAREWVLQEYSTRALAKKTESVFLESLGRNVNERRIKVAFVTSFPRDPEVPRGGVEAVSVNLVKALAALGGLEINIVTTDPETKEETVSEWSGIPVHRMPRLGNRRLLEAVFHGRRQVQGYIRGLRPDVVHAHDLYGLMVKNLDIPRVFTVHGFIHRDIQVSTRPYRALISRIWRMAETSGWAEQPHIISISPYVREGLKGISTGRIHDIENPISEEFFQIPRNERKGTVFCSAVISRRKNTRSLVEAVIKLISSGTDVELRLAGEVDEDILYGRKVRDLVRTSRQEDRVKFLGHISSEEVRKELSAASIFALVSLEENSPMGIGEAMAAGVPVVTSNRCGMPYMVRHGESGFLVDPNNIDDIAFRLRQLLENDALRAAMGRKSREIALDRFHPDAVARRTLDVYYEAAGFGERRTS
jgi:glycosyltransferase involved in cell wall biosynthesis